ncbi:hypothetical protein QYM36_000119, partial [Artemia franciscana]
METMGTMETMVYTNIPWVYYPWNPFVHVRPRFAYADDFSLLLQYRCLFCIYDVTPIPKKVKSKLSAWLIVPIGQYVASANIVPIGFIVLSAWLIAVSNPFCKLFEVLFVDELKKCSVPPYQLYFQDKIGCFDALSAVAYALMEGKLTGESLAQAEQDVRHISNLLV